MTRLASRGIRRPPRPFFLGFGSSFLLSILVLAWTSFTVSTTQKTALLAKPGHVGIYGTITYTRARQLAWIRTDGPRRRASDRKGSSGSRCGGRWCRPSALAASVCDESCRPRAAARTNSSTDLCYSRRPRPPNEGGPDRWRRAVHERWPPVGATAQPLPQPGTAQQRSAPNPE